METQKAVASLLATLPAVGMADHQVVSRRHQVEGRACRLVEERVDLVEEGREGRRVVVGNRDRRREGRDLVLWGMLVFVLLEEWVGWKGSVTYVRLEDRRACQERVEGSSLVDL